MGQPGGTSATKGNKRDGNLERISTDTIQYSLFRSIANALQVECHSDSGCWPVSEMLVPDPAREVRLPENGSHQFRGRVPVGNPETILKQTSFREKVLPARCQPRWSLASPVVFHPHAKLSNREHGSGSRKASPEMVPVYDCPLVKNSCGIGVILQ